MNKGWFMLLGMVALFLLTPALVLGWSFDYEAYGNILVSPVYYSGVLTSGGDGTFDFTLSDGGWPTDPAARFDHIWDTYFRDNYDSTTPGAYKWVGQITGRFYLDADNTLGYNGTCEGSINAKITVRDLDEDEVLDDTEKWAEHLFDGRLSKLCDDLSTGDMACKFGSGSLASNYFNFVMPPGVDDLYNGGSLNLFPGCPSANEQASWSSIKALYR
jgi:hypothetical protein